MNEFLDITGGDIAKLADDDLRTLIGLLCEADCRKAGISPSGITWGGHQDAKDGGLDVFVTVEKDNVSGYLPTKKVGLQVKKPDMLPSAIKNEMRPDNVLRDTIELLIRDQGSYIIVSSTASTSHQAFQKRKAAMREAVIDEDRDEKLVVDFYDQGRIASWVRTHPAMIVWVKNRNGRRLQGWQPYENWSRPGHDVDDYLLDDAARLYDGSRTEPDRALTLKNGLTRIRSILSEPRSCVRLAGLSGVGKTRFSQALFDERIGSNALDHTKVFYTDLSNAPDPGPVQFANSLIGLEASGILVVDNCQPDLHRQLALLCSSPKSKLSLLTVEYDVREDLPDETDVFLLEPGSEELVAKLVQQRYSHLSKVDAERIANISGGNPRIALAMANTLKSGETIVGLRDEQLFDRLFHQRNQPDNNLKTTAEVLSLVYSFDGENVEEESELDVLANLIHKPVTQVYRDIAELKKRDLIQSRSHWRAILPHAIANKLAENALQTIPRPIVEKAFLTAGRERLLKSFTRRLNYLHDSAVARSIVDNWTSAGGWLFNLNIMDEEHFQILENIAPVSPDHVIDIIERLATLGKSNNVRHSSHTRVISLLRSLAYEPSSFKRCVLMLIDNVLGADPSRKHDNSKDVLKTLFRMHLSGTHASVEQRFDVIDELMASSHQPQQELGVVLLETMLHTGSVTSHHGFSFGARSRNYGYQPETWGEFFYWYRVGLERSLHYISTHSAVASAIKSTLANKFRGLWGYANLRERLVEIAEQVAASEYWGDGWISVKTILRYDTEDQDKPQLLALEKLLRPQTVADQIRAFALMRGVASLDLEEDDKPNGNEITERWQRLDAFIMKLAVDITTQPAALDTLLPEFFSPYALQVWTIGRGLAMGSHDPEILWQKLTQEFLSQSQLSPQVNVLSGFLHQLQIRDGSLANRILDNLVDDSKLGRWFPHFQTAAPVDALGVARLHRSLELNIAPIEFFKSLGHGRTFQTLTDTELANLLVAILKQPYGDDVALDVLSMRFYGNEDTSIDTVLIEAGRLVLEGYRFSEENTNQMMDHNLSSVAERCLDGGEAVRTTEVICQKITASLYAYSLPYGQCNTFLCIVARKQSLTFLNAFIGGEDLEYYQWHNLFEDYYPNHKNPLSLIPDDIIINWCEENPLTRYKKITQRAEFFQYDQTSSQLVWTLITYKLIKQAPNLDEVLQILASRLKPRSWSNSHADALERYLALPQALFEHDDEGVSEWAKTTYLYLEKSIKQHRRQEKEDARRINESFE